ncbi:MAG: sn-glycerol-1-phosphate dehydrogenase [Alphaproteobacteria bacterium]|nr:sn-glycerol-1-phosphate dehydrogenase [Alphaproteobacteria bacterium]
MTDERIWKNCRRFFPKNFLDEYGKILFLKDPQADEKNLKLVVKAVRGCDSILALGSGVISDLSKLASTQSKIPYAIFASAPSMNGYLSRNASITISGHKKTLPATLPEAVFVDLRILRSAPLRLIRAGIGDSLCFYSCWFDWYLSHKILGTKFDVRPFEMLYAKMDSLLKNFRKFSLRDEEFLRLLMEILLLSGEGMTLAGGSYPASQSEHMIAHTIEMKYPEIAKKKLHGELIAVATVTSAGLQEGVLSAQCPVPSAQRFIKKFFSPKIAKQCEREYAAKIVLKSKNSWPKKISWPRLKKELSEIHLSKERLQEIFLHFKIKTSPKSLGLTSQQYQACIAHAKLTRNRFTCLDLQA